MSDDREETMVGNVLWQDLTVDNAVEVRDFYQQMIGWDCLPEEMGDYQDYHMIAPSTGNSVAGICHARGVNADIPPVWMVYISVEDIFESATVCEKLGGEILLGPRQMGAGLVCVIRDPAGAICALYQSEKKA